jgi:membrane protein YdbS with pleckstrin-like domain
MDCVIPTMWSSQYLCSEQWHDIYLIITKCYKIVLISSIKEGYIAMINSTDKISMRVSCSIVVVFIVFSQVDAIELWHTLVWLFDVSG